LEQTKVVVIGLGRIASLLEDDAKREKPASHAGAFSTLPDAQLAAGWDTNPERCELFTQRWNVPTEFEGVRHLLTTIKPEIAVMATYPDSHADLVRLACELEVPVVVCEKPITSDLPSARRLVHLVSKSRTKVMINHERRYARDYRRVKAIIRDKTYGILQNIRASLFMGRGRTPAEVLLWDGTHLLDLLRYLTSGEITQVQTWGRVEQPGGRLTGRFLTGGVETWFEVAANRDHLVFELDLSFERGRIRVGNGLYEEFAGAPSPLYDKMRSLVPVTVDPAELFPTEYFSAMARDAVRAAREPGYGPVSTAADGLAALEAIDLLLRRSGSSLKRMSRMF